MSGKPTLENVGTSDTQIKYSSDVPPYFQKYNSGYSFITTAETYSIPIQSTNEKTTTPIPKIYETNKIDILQSQNQIETSQNISNKSTHYSEDGNTHLVEVASNSGYGVTEIINQDGTNNISTNNDSNCSFAPQSFVARPALQEIQSSLPPVKKNNKKNNWFSLCTNEPQIEQPSVLQTFSSLPYLYLEHQKCKNSILLLGTHDTGINFSIFFHLSDHYKHKDSFFFQKKN